MTASDIKATTTMLATDMKAACSAKVLARLAVRQRCRASKGFCVITGDLRVVP